MATSTSALSAPRPPAVVPRTGPWVAGGAGALALVLVAGWFLVIAPQRAAMVETEDSITQAQSTATVLTNRVAQLKQQYASLPELQAELASLQTQMPADAALPELVRALRTAAQSTGAELTGLTPAAPEALGAAETAAAPASTAPDTASTTSSTTTAATATTTATASGASGAAGAQGLLQVPVTVIATGSYASLQQFLSAVQQQQRLFLVTGTSFAPGGGASSTDLTLTVTGDVFVLDTTGTAGSAAAATAAPSGAAVSGLPTAAPAGGATASPTAVPTAAPTGLLTAAIPTATTTSAG